MNKEELTAEEKMNLYDEFISNALKRDDYDDYIVSYQSYFDFAEHYHEIKSKEDGDKIARQSKRIKELKKDKLDLINKVDSLSELKKCADGNVFRLQARAKELEEKLERAEYLNKINSKANPKTK